MSALDALRPSGDDAHRARALALAACLALPWAGCTPGAGEAADPAGEGEGEGEGEVVFEGVADATTDGPGEVTVFWTPATGPGPHTYRVFTRQAPTAPDLAGDPDAVVTDTDRATLRGLPRGRTLRVAVAVGDLGAHAVLEVSTDVPTLQPAEVWWRDLEFGAFSSPGLGDFDGDGVLDFVAGTGAENVSGGVLALSGATGEPIWSVAARGEMVGSPAMADLNGDGTLDTLIGGRNPQVLALDGRTGAELWSLDTTAWVSSPALVRSGDALTALITIGGLGSRAGDPDFDRTNPEHHLDRWSPGRLYAIDTSNGTIVGRLTSEEYEYYASPAVADVDGDGAPEAIIGSGGHTLAGEVIVVDMQTWKPKWSRSSGAKGVVASPCVADLDGDGLPDVVAASEDQHAAAYRGYDGEPLWRVDRPDLEYVSGPSAGWGLRQPTPTVLVAGAKGQWTDHYESGIRTAVDGRTGDVLWEHETEGRFLIATPLWVDLTGNGLDDVIASEIEFSPAEGVFYTRLRLLHGGTGEEMGVVGLDAALIATPTIADIDGDGELDLLWIGMQGPIDQRGALPGAAGRIGLGVPAPPEDRGISWDRFRGNPDNTGALITPPPR